jgi:hypothetical protein
MDAARGDQPMLMHCNVTSTAIMKGNLTGRLSGPVSPSLGSRRVVG